LNGYEIVELGGSGFLFKGTLAKGLVHDEGGPGCRRVKGRSGIWFRQGRLRRGRKESAQTEHLFEIDDNLLYVNLNLGINCAQLKGVKLKNKNDYSI